jgi:hypothetical protein
VSNSKRRKTKIETLTIVSESRGTQRRLVGARLHGHPLRVKATKLPRRRFLHLAAGAAALSAVSRIARAQAFPTRPVRLLVGFVPGGGADTLARLMVNGCRIGSGSLSLSKTEQAREGTSPPRRL